MFAPATPTATRVILAILAALCLTVSACSGPRAISAYRTAQPVDSLLAQPSSIYTIACDDKVAVSIWQHDDISIGSVFGIYNSSEGYGKWVMVQPDSTIILPRLGPVKVAGLTTAQASDTVAAALSGTIVDPLVVVKVLNREVTVLGEVRTPGNYLLDKQQNTLAELIGRAQGYTDYANTRYIVLLRNQQAYRIDLKHLSAMQRNNLLVAAGDVIEVPSQRGKRIDKKAPTLIPFASVLTALAIGFTTFINKS